MTRRTSFRDLLASIETDPIRLARMADRRQTDETVLVRLRPGRRRGYRRVTVAAKKNLSQERMSRN